MEPVPLSLLTNYWINLAHLPFCKVSFITHNFKFFYYTQFWDLKKSQYTIYSFSALKCMSHFKKWLYSFYEEDLYCLWTQFLVHAEDQLWFEIRQPHYSSEKSTPSIGLLRGGPYVPPLMWKIFFPYIPTLCSTVVLSQQGSMPLQSPKQTGIFILSCLCTWFIL